jgi:hypothetical protein
MDFDPRSIDESRDRDDRGRELSQGSRGGSPIRAKGKRLFADNSEPRAFKLTHSAVSPNGVIHETYARDGEVQIATVGGAQEPNPAELARREKLKREG